MTFSIITINKDNAVGLEATIASVSKQDASLFEHIIVDGGSVDGSVDVIRRSAYKVSWWVSEPDSGIYNAMNKGIRNARGDYCVFLNSGDCFIRGDILTRLSSMLSPEVDILYSDAVMVKGKTSRIDWSPRHVTPGFFLVSTLNHQNTAIRRRLLLEEGLYREDLRIASDWYFFLRATSRRRVEFRYVPYPIAAYDNDGLSSTPGGAALNERERADCIRELFSGIEPIIAELRSFVDSRFGSITRHFGYRTSLDRILRAYRITLRVLLGRYGKKVQ